MTAATDTKATYLTSKAHRAQVRADAAVDFKNHVITPIVDEAEKRVRVFKCATPNDSNHLKFYVSVLPTAILVHGDIGELLIDHPSGGLGWLLDSVESTDYFLGKAYKLKETQFCPGDALALLDDAEQWRDEETRAAVRAEWSPDYEGEYRGDDARRWREVVHEVTGDFDYPDCLDYDRESLWCYEALRWFAANYRAVLA